MNTVGLLIDKNGKPIEVEKTDKLFICPFCLKEYKNKGTLINHLKSEHLNEFTIKEEENNRK